MSGVSLAVAASGEQERDTERKQQKQEVPPMGLGGGLGSLRIIELQLVAFIMVFSASGLVPLLDLVFPALASAYIVLLSRFVFPVPGRKSSRGAGSSGQEIFQGNRWFRVYVILGTVIGLFLPLAYVLGGFARGDDHAVRSATPHLFLLSCQILTEHIITGLSLFSPPVRALVPLLYTVRRIFVIADWIQDVWVHMPLGADAPIKDKAWFWFGRCLAIANLVYFSVNLLAFLIPRFLPKAFERYFEDSRDELHMKKAEDERSATSPSTSESTDKKTT
ncbi:hypothetical protein Droror1_Dr00003503 [Drosera rotundifolia]